MNLRTITFLTAVFALPAVLCPPVADAQPAPDNSSIWTLQDENASISAGHPTDRFYVNGLSLGWVSPTTVVPDFLADLGKTLWGPAEMRVGVALTQQIYTPADTVPSTPKVACAKRIASLAVTFTAAPRFPLANAPSPWARRLNSWHCLCLPCRFVCPKSNRVPGRHNFRFGRRLSAHN